jgi:hypothetical protein
MAEADRVRVNASALEKNIEFANDPDLVNSFIAIRRAAKRAAQLPVKNTMVCICSVSATVMNDRFRASKV